MKKSILVIMVLIALVLGACTPAATVAPTTVPVESTAAPVEPTAAPTEATTVAPAAEPVTLTVLAAASLTTPFINLGVTFEADNPGVTVQFSFAGSQDLAEQLKQGVEADVFASASKKYMDAVVEAGRVTRDTQKTFARNGLVVIVPSTNPAGITTLKDLASKGIKLDLAAKEVPVGQYTLDFLDKAVADAELGATYKEDVLANVVSYEDNVKSVLAKVALGEADAGIVYKSDVSGDDASKVTMIEIPEALNVIASYPIAVLNDSKNAEMAQAFMDMVLGEAGQAELNKVGFLSPAAAAPAAASGIDVTDALGRNIHFDKAPEKIVLTGKALFMVADAIYAFPEAGQRITAIGSTAQNQNDFIATIDTNIDSKTRLEGDAGPEQIAALQPDCVILKSIMAEKLGTPLEELKIPVVYVDFETPDTYYRDIEMLGKLFQNEARAAELINYFKSKLEAISTAEAGIADADKPSTLVIYYTDKDGETAFNVPPTGWMQTLMIETAGGAPVWGDANPGNGWAKVTLEQIAAWNPDVIFLVSYLTPVNDVVANLNADPLWQALDAVKNDKLYGFATDFYSYDQPDPRWILGMQWTAAKLYPDLFAGNDITTAAKDFYKTFYAVDDATFAEKIEPFMTGDIH